MTSAVTEESLVERLRARGEAMASAYSKRERDAVTVQVDEESVFEASCAFGEAADAIERLTKERDEALRHVELLSAKVDGPTTCACVYDFPDDLCAHHSPQLAAAEARLEQMIEARRLMHRRAQRAEGQRDAAVHVVVSWASHPVMKTPGGYLAREVCKEASKALTRRAALPTPTPEPTND